MADNVAHVLQDGTRGTLRNTNGSRLFGGGKRKTVSLPEYEPCLGKTLEPAVNLPDLRGSLGGRLVVRGDPGAGLPGYAMGGHLKDKKTVFQGLPTSL